MPSRNFLLCRRTARFSAPHPLAIVFLVLFLAATAHAAAIRGVVTDTTGARVKGATVGLLSGGKVVASGVSTADGSYEILTGLTGRFYIVVSAKSFRQL